MNTARATFHQLADQVHAHLTPAGRATAVAASLRQVGDLAGDLPLSVMAAAASFQLLAVGKSTETAAILARRATCLELASLLGQMLSEAELSATSILDRVVDVSHMIAVLDHVAKVFGQTEDPRQKAMAVTAMRESSELGDYVAHISPARE